MAKDPCNECSGTGRKHGVVTDRETEEETLIGYPCPDCNGSGKK